MENTKRTHRRRRRILLPLLMAGSALITAAGATFSLALFTDSASASANSFTTGTIHIGINPAATILSAPAMMPGDVVNGSVVVSNTGTAQLRYAISGSATNTDTKGLASQINIQIKTADTAGGNTCTAFTGTSLFNGTVPYAEGALFANYAVHPNGGRVLDAGLGETLCFRATLPSTTPGAFEGATTTMTFTFYAEQTANNP
jgi:predicted ribosomally synthesized peptide with SipW-like signal peptide